MNVTEAMAMIAEEAERQGFLVRQTRQGTWMLRTGNDTYVVAPHNVTALMDVMAILIGAGLDWSRTWED